MRVLNPEDFPPGLRQVRPGVKQLYYKGNLDNKVFERCLGIVGSRRMTNYGQRVVEKIVPALVEAGMTIVSGFMYGVDQAAHRVCLENEGQTIAVLGWGIDWPVGEEDEKLYGQIARNGLIVSEYEGSQSAQLWMFPQRNRIIAGLSQAVLVIEAGEKSGSLITAEWAGKFGRPVLAVPGPVTSAVSRGTNRLIKEGKAGMVESGEEVLEAMGWQSAAVSRGPTSSWKRSDLYMMLESEGLTVDELARKLKKPAEEMGAELSILQLRGEIEEREGRYYIK